MNAPSRSEKTGARSQAKKKPTWRERAKAWLGKARPHLPFAATLLVGAIVIHILIRPPAAEDISRFQIDQPAPRLLSAPFQFDFINEIATEARRRQAEALVAPVYRVDSQALNKMTQTIEALAAAAQSVRPASHPTVAAWGQEAQRTAGVSLPERIYEAADGQSLTPASVMIRWGTGPELWNAMLQSVYNSVGMGVADTIKPLEPLMNSDSSQQRARVAVGVNLIDPNGGERAVFALDQIRTSEQFFSRFQAEFQKQFQPGAPAMEVYPFASDVVAQAYAGPTLLYDAEETESRRLEASSRIEVVRIVINKDETIIGKDEIVTPGHLQALRALNQRMRIAPIAELGYFFLAAMFIGILLKFTYAYYPAVAEKPQRIAVVLACVVLLLGLTRAAEYVSMLDLGRNTLRDVPFAIPMGALGVILTILAGARMATFTCGLTSIYAGIILTGAPGSPILYALVCFITACGAIYTVTRIRQRSDLYRAGGVSILLAAFLILAIDLQMQTSFEGFIGQVDVLKYALAWGVLNGVLVSVLAIALMPIFEDLYGKTTDIRLLELSQKNELLHRLEHEAPGSYQHSMRVATLAETAADAIGAHALLTRVGCYYHDIGKVVSSQYFVENQQSSADKAKHSKMKPTMSCMIIRNHVKHGIEMARQHGLPEEIIGFIPEHHGTTLMAYFYHQALSEAESEDKVKEEDYRYPGPKPQSRETAIVMLADALEATSRLLENPSEREVRQLVRKIINERFMDGQFNECELTLKDLEQLYHTFSETILHMLHQRIHYPGPPRKEGDRAAAPSRERGGDEGREAPADEHKIKSNDPDRLSANGDAAPDLEDQPVTAIKEKRGDSRSGGKSDG